MFSLSSGLLHAKSNIYCFQPAVQRKKYITVIEKLRKATHAYYSRSWIQLFAGIYCLKTTTKIANHSFSLASVNK